MTNSSTIDNSTPQKITRWSWICIVLFSAIWFYMLGARTLVPTDEGRYAEMAREMVVSGDWVTPRLNAIKYFEKPPLQTWMNAITFELLVWVNGRHVCGLDCPDY